MIAYTVSRLIQLVPVLLLASIAIWLMIYLIPGNPAETLLGPNVTAQQIALERAHLGLNQPLPVQYIIWLGRVIHGDFGVSYISGLPAISLIAQRAPASLQLAVASFILALLIGIPFGVVAAVRPRSWLSNSIAGYNSLSLAVPTFWLGTLLILLFGVRLGWLPTSSTYVPFWQDPPGAIQALAMPVITLALGISGIVARFVRVAMLDVMHQDYIRTARAKGVREWSVILRHGLRNALLPTITVVGLQFGSFIGGAVVTEAVFDYPGLGSLVLTAVLQRDYTVLQATILLLVLAFALVNLCVDIAYAYLDPRIRYS